jgi:hypothetical protein
MARKTYGHTDETRAVLSGNEAAIAREMECDASYIFAIKNAKEPDRYPRFRELFRAAARGGADVSPWMNDLTSIVESVKPAAKETEDLGKFVVAKFHDESLSTEEFLRSMSDGRLDEHEIDELLTLLERVKSNAVRGIGLLARQKARLRGEIRQFPTSKGRVS